MGTPLVCTSRMSGLAMFFFAMCWFAAAPDEHPATIKRTTDAAHALRINKMRRLSPPLSLRGRFCRTVQLLEVAQHFLGRRSVFPGRFELEVLRQRRLRLGGLSGAGVDHPQLVPGDGE